MTKYSICCNAGVNEDYQNLERCPECKEPTGFYSDEDPDEEQYSKRYPETDLRQRPRPTYSEMVELEKDMKFKEEWAQFLKGILYE